MIWLLFSSTFRTQIYCLDSNTIYKNCILAKRKSPFGRNCVALSLYFSESIWWIFTGLGIRGITIWKFHNESNETVLNRRVRHACMIRLRTVCDTTKSSSENYSEMTKSHSVEHNLDLWFASWKLNLITAYTWIFWDFWRVVKSAIFHIQPSWSTSHLKSEA